MRNIIFSIIFLATSLSYSQEVVRPANDFYSADSTQNRTDLSRAILDGIKIWKDGGFVAKTVKLHQPTLELRLPKIDISSNEKRIVTLDTLEYADFVIRKATNSSHRGGWFNLRKTFHYYKDVRYMIDTQEYGDQPSRYVLDSVRSIDSTQVTRQFFFTKHWLFSKREHNNIDSLKVTEFTPFAYTPGTTVIDGDTVRRHTQTFRTKYFQVRAKDTTYNVIDTLPIYGNPFMKLP